MGKSNDNVLTHGMRGKIGDLLVFRIVDGKTVVSKAPSKVNREASGKQLELQEHFQEAVIYGKTVMVTEDLRSQYEVDLPVGRSVYHLALADFLRAPKIKEADVEEYTGKPGSKIRVRAIDDFKVKSVKVTIYNSDGTLVETGDAVAAANGVDWIYTATADNVSLSGDKIVIVASDLPGNKTESDLIL